MNTSIKVTRTVFLSFLILQFCLLNCSSKMTPKLVRVEFEVHGKVQRVFFRRWTKITAIELGIRGWCMNTYKEETVKGVLEGEPEKIKEMKKWLQEKGSPGSKVEKAIFSLEKAIDKFSFDEFEIRPTQ